LLAALLARDKNTESGSAQDTSHTVFSIFTLPQSWIYYNPIKFFTVHKLRPPGRRGKTDGIFILTSLLTPLPIRKPPGSGYFAHRFQYFYPAAELDLQ
jgi:hypothetical protein